jgi:hypothetical protein
VSISKLANVIIPVADPDRELLKDRGVDVDEVSGFGDAVPPLFWLRDPEGNTLMVVEAR